MAAPTLTKVTPLYGSSAGGNIVNIEGTGFSVAGFKAYFGDVLATSWAVGGDTAAALTVPASSAVGAVPIKIVTNDGSVVSASKFNYSYLGASVPTGLYQGLCPFFDLEADYRLFGQIQFVQQPISADGSAFASFDPAANYTITGDWSIAGDWEFTGQFTLTADTGNVVLQAVLGDIKLQAFGLGSKTQVLGQEVDVYANGLLDLKSTGSDVSLAAPTANLYMNAAFDVAITSFGGVLSLNTSILRSPSLPLASKANILYYDTVSKDISYAPVPSGVLPLTDEVAGPVAMAENNSYAASGAGAITFNLPAVAALGSEFQVVGNSAFNWVVQANVGQTIIVGNVASAPGGTATANNGGDNITLKCVVANSVFRAVSVVGNINVV